MFNNPEAVILFFLSGTLAVLGNFLLKVGINQIGSFSLKLALNWQVVMGFLLYGLSSILYLKLLTTTEITKSYPALVAYMSLVLLILGALFLKESLTAPKVAGIFVILVGIFLISR